MPTILKEISHWDQVSKIVQELSELKITKNDNFEYFINDNFVLRINTNPIQEVSTRYFYELSGLSSIIENKVTDHEMVDVTLYEIKKCLDSNSYYQSYIDLERDSRFSNYQPIKYSGFPGGSYGIGMPISHLCELIIYLYRLSNLTVFI